MSVHLDSEREVEMFFASPLFHGLGYTEEHEAAGFRFVMWEGVSHRTVEADLVYFADEHLSLDDGVPLVLVEVKGSDQPADAGKGQARSYAFWVMPAYYVTTNGMVVVVYNYQGGNVPDVKVLEFNDPTSASDSMICTACSTRKRLLKPGRRRQTGSGIVSNPPRRDASSSPCSWRGWSVARPDRNTGVT